MASTSKQLSEKLDELREYGVGLGLSDDEINDCFLEILGERKSKNAKAKKQKNKRGCVRRTCRVLVGCFLGFMGIVAAVFVAASVDDHVALFVQRHLVTPIAYPVLRFTRSIGLFLSRTLDRDFIDYYDTNCLIDNPLYINAIDPNDCSFCTEVTEVRLLSNISRKEFKDSMMNTGSLIMVKDSDDSSIPLAKLQEGCLHEMHKIRSGASQFFFPKDSSLKGISGFFEDMTEESVLADENFHAVWYARRVGPGQVLRKYFPRPYFFRSKQEMSLERKVFVDNPSAPAYPIAQLSMHNMWYVQSSGQRTLVFTPKGNCQEECQTIHVDVKKGDLVYWDDMFWNVDSEPTAPPEGETPNISVSLLGAFA